jgi:hypothetical protein
MTEKEIERYFCKRVRALGGFAYKFRSITQIGVADRIACMPNGEAWFVEIKQPNGGCLRCSVSFRTRWRTPSSTMRVCGR